MQKIKQRSKINDPYSVFGAAGVSVYFIAKRDALPGAKAGAGPCAKSIAGAQEGTGNRGRRGALDFVVQTWPLLWAPEHEAFFGVLGFREVWMGQARH